MPNRPTAFQPIVATGARILAATPEYVALAASIRAEITAAYAERIAAAGGLRRVWLRWRRQRAVARAINARLRPPGALY